MSLIFTANCCLFDLTQIAKHILSDISLLAIDGILCAIAVVLAVVEFV